MQTTVMARRMVDAAGESEYPRLVLEAGRIVHIESVSPADYERSVADYCFPDATLVPAYVDIHMHGCAGHDVMEATTQALDRIGGYLASRGVGAYFPTTVTSTREETLRALSGLAREIELRSRGNRCGATPLGIHLEGPFLSHSKRGVHIEALLEPPSIELFDEFWQAAEGRIRLMTIAPELLGAVDLIRHASGLGVRCSLGHSNALACEAAEGMRAGACSTTHTFNAMRAIDHREPGLAAFVLDEDSLYAEIICDGVHVDPMILRLFRKVKNADHIVLVTDSISATGMPEGAYQLGKMKIEVKDGRCTSSGTLAGSVLTLDKGVRNFMEFTGAGLKESVAGASINPSRLMGIDDDWGSIEVGREANFLVLSPDACVIQSFLAGRPFLEEGIS